MRCGRIEGATTNPNQDNGAKGDLMDLWWIEDEDGDVITTGRCIDRSGRITDAGLPRLQASKSDAQKLCREGETPVQVKLVVVN